MSLKDITGQRFARLTVIGRAENATDGTARWKCVCDCGDETVSSGSNLRRGSARSCGCLQKEHARRVVSKAHDAVRKYEKRDYLYRAWSGIKTRCFNPKCREWHNYGGRGITVAEEWRNDFLAFAAAVGHRPTPDHSLDRIDNNGNYEPGNVRWATRIEQASNRRGNLALLVNGETLTASEAARRVGLPPNKVTQRLRYGWSVERALS